MTRPQLLDLAARVEAARLREALEIIAGRRQCADNLLSNGEIARIVLDDPRPIAEAQRDD
jgi:hypothetical protein